MSESSPLETPKPASETVTPAAKKPRRRFRFSLRTLMIAVVLLSVFFAWAGNIILRVRHQRAMITQIEEWGGSTTYGYEHDLENPERVPPGPKLLRLIFGDDAFAYVEWVTLVAPHGDEDLAIVREFPRLEVVDIYGENVTDDGMKQIAKITTLDSIILGDTSVTAKGLAVLGKLPQLVSLALLGDDYDDETLAGLREIPQLEYLVLSKPKITTAGLEYVGELHELKSFAVYWGDSIDDAGLAHLAELRQLKSLHLQQTNIQGPGLVHLSEMQQLKLLQLTGSPVNDEGLEFLSSLPQLGQLFLDYTKVSDGGLKSLSQLNSLRCLNLSGTNISNEGLQHLQTLTQLEQLYLHGTQVTDKGIQQLASLEQLKELTVPDGVSFAAAQELHESLPGCNIHCDGNGNTGAGGYDIEAQPEANPDQRELE